TLGEGWHNTHHAHPRAASNQVRWWEVDMSMWVVVILEKLGLVWNVQRPNMQAQPKQRKLPA
ncbi:MAG: hypothetical protein PHE36_09840, partial [Novosphingobium sp.]|nr:hypothetical protein [Novosphingobium sp.]